MTRARQRWLLSLACVTAAMLTPSDGQAADARAQPVQQSRAPVPESRKFDILEYRIQGNTVLPEVIVDDALEPFLGPGKSVSDIQGAADALNRAYKANGFETVSATIPVQNVVNGVVALKVVETKVGRLRVTGSRYFDLDVIKKGAPSLAEGSVLKLSDVQKDIVGLNQQPDRAITPVLKQGKSPDTVDVDLEVRDKLPLHATLELNNQQSPSTTPLRLNGSLSYSNLWQRGDAATFQFQVAPERPADALVLSGSYLYHVPGSPVSVIASFLHSSSNVSTLGSTTVVGRGNDAGLHAIIPLGVDGNFIHSADVGIDYKRFYEADRFGGQTSFAPLTWYPVTAAYNAVWSGDGATTSANASVAFSFAGLGSPTVAFQNKRADATPGFIVLRGSLDHTQAVWRETEVSAHLTAQLSPQPLITNEQFNIGGINSIRGYLEGAVLGDYGVALQTELRSPPLANLVGEEPNELRGFGFVDAGTASIYNPLAGQTHSYTLGSTGLGIRARVFDAFSGEVLGAVPFSSTLGTKAGHPRVLFRATAGF